MWAWACEQHRRFRVGSSHFPFMTCTGWWKGFKNVFKNKGDSIVNCPVAFYYIINNYKFHTLCTAQLLEIENFQYYFANLCLNEFIVF